MLSGLLADAVVVVHAAFVAFVALGGLLVWRRRGWMWLHLPALAWGVAIELGGWICPLTPLENHLRRMAGQSGYHGDFIERYLLPMLYPAGLTRGSQVALAVLALAINAVVYGRLLLRRRGI